MNFARVGNSPRLQRVLHVLRHGTSKGLWHSTFDLNLAARVTSAGTAISELEHQGYTIYHRRMTKSQSFEYRLIKEPETVKFAPALAPSNIVKQSEMFGVNAFGQAVIKKEA